MLLKDLQPRQGNVEVSVDVVEKESPREFQKFGRTGKVATAKVKDESGEMNLTLWNEDVDNVNVGDKIKIVNGYVNEWQGEPQLTTGKFGKIEMIEKGTSEETKEEEEEAPSEDLNVEEEPVENSKEED